MIYVNNRRQFGQNILLFQGVGFLLTDLWARTTNLTLALLKFCESYDEKVEKFGGSLPGNIAQGQSSDGRSWYYNGLEKTL